MLIGTSWIGVGIPTTQPIIFTMVLGVWGHQFCQLAKLLWIEKLVKDGGASPSNSWHKLSKAPWRWRLRSHNWLQSFPLLLQWCLHHCNSKVTARTAGIFFFWVDVGTLVQCVTFDLVLETLARGRQAISTWSPAMNVLGPWRIVAAVWYS